MSDDANEDLKRQPWRLSAQHKSLSFPPYTCNVTFDNGNWAWNIFEQGDGRGLRITPLQNAGGVAGSEEAAQDCALQVLAVALYLNGQHGPKPKT